APPLPYSPKERPINLLVLQWPKTFAHTLHYDQNWFNHRVINRTNWWTVHGLWGNVDHTEALPDSVMSFNDTINRMLKLRYGRTCWPNLSHYSGEKTILS